MLVFPPEIIFWVEEVEVVSYCTAWAPQLSALQQSYSPTISELCSADSDTPEWHTVLTHESDTPSWHTVLTHRLDTREWHTVLTHRSDTPEWHTRVTHRSDTLEWHTGASHGADRQRWPDEDKNIHHIIAGQTDPGTVNRPQAAGEELQWESLFTYWSLFLVTFKTEYQAPTERDRP